MDFLRKKAEFNQLNLFSFSRPKCLRLVYYPLRKCQAEFERLQALFESIPCIQFILDTQCQIISISEFGATALGYEAGQLRQVSMASLCYSEDRAECQEKLTELPQQTPRVSQWKTRLLCQNGRVIWVNARARLVSFGESEAVISLVCEEIADFEPRETLQHQLERSLAELHWREALLRTMTSASPLAFYVVDKRTGAILYFNHRFCEIWDIEHLEEKMQQGELKNGDIIPHCLPLITDVPAFAKTCHPLQNEAKPSWIRVATELDESGQHATIRIADNGLGMTEPVKQKLFDLFFTTKPVGRGMGLGLSISYQIVVEKHGGRLYCHSELGKGTEFAIEIPQFHF